MISGSTTNVGGGSVGSSLINKLAERYRAVKYSNYDWATYVFHALSLMMKRTIKEVFGKGGLTKRTFLQLLHTAYNLKQQYVTKIWRKLWKTATDT